MSNILLTGVTGYVGGTVLSQLLASTEPSLTGLTFDLLVRDAEKAKKLEKEYGNRVNPIQWAGLEDTSFIEDIAANYDIIINVASGFIAPGAIAFVKGLARRVGPDKPAPWMLHISGCTNLADRPLTQREQPFREWEDEKDATAILEQLKALDEKEPYSQRTAEVGVLEAAAARGVQAVSVNTPVIFGEGTGLFNRQGLVIPSIMGYVVQHGYGWKLNETANFDRVHILDLADLFVLLVRTIIERPDRGVGHITSGKPAVIFSEAGRVLIKDINQRCLDVAFASGILPREGTPKDKEIRLVTLQEIADELTAGSMAVAERGWAGHKSTKGVRARALGWEPTRLQEAWEQDFLDELVALQENRRMMSMASCIGTSKK
ncbi:NAD(P)-binding protein [Massarina eburnea CBS 473.64]|uniref:NAD(P)-binding protein n=1 Tax=Massarina eburnea CBS 473.64 TaxID=1395130 RepID=A0A6A6S5M0_9PLEO|nr:NAD(P)-binding protein [Massarina eburnea CBS 473.64]